MNILLICIKIDINCTYLVMVPTMPPATEAKVVVTADLKYQNYNVSSHNDGYLNTSELLVIFLFTLPQVSTLARIYQMCFHS